MGSKPSREDKAMSPLSSWGGSFDELVCGRGKICAELLDQWTPIPSREQSPSIKTFERSRSVASLGRLNRGYDDDDDIEVIRQQPLPMDTHSIRTPIEIVDFDRPRTTTNRGYLPQHTTLSPKPGRSRKRKRKKKAKAETKMYPAAPIQIFIDSRKTVEIDPLNRTVTRLDGVPARRSVAKLAKVSPYRHRSASEPQTNRRMVPVYNGRKRMRSLPRKQVYPVGTISTFAMSSTNSENASSLRSTRRVVPPRHLRPFPIPPPQPFRFRHLPDQPYHRIRTASHPHL